MARVTYRANLSPKGFPFLSRDMGRSIIIPQSDQNFSRYLSSEVTVDKDIGIPQVYYCHNVLPVDAGLASVGYSLLVNPTEGYTFVDAWSVRASEKDYKLAVSSTGQFFIVSSGLLSWSAIELISAAAGVEITVAIVQGTTYVQVAGANCYRFSETLAPTAPTVALGAAGALTGVYSYKITFVTADGETEGGTKSVEVTAAAQRIELTAIPVSDDPTVTARKIYRTAAGGSIHKLVTTLADNTTTVYSDNIADGSLGATAPTVGTTLAHLTAVALIGLTDGANPIYPKGITTFSGYLVAWTKDAFYWSSTVNPLDFVPDLATGAGGGQVESAKGNIVFCAPFAAGLYVYTDKNVVSAIYSSNIRYPFTFKEISQAGGIASSKLVATESIVFKPYAYTASGLQEISATTGAKAVFPQATDFLSSSLFEDYFGGQLQTYDVTDVIQKSVAQISDRFLVLSYGVGSLTHALVYDQSLERWGKIKKPHVSVIEWDIVPPEVTETPKNSTALLQSDGTVLLVNQRAQGEAVLYLGKYQYVRARMIQLQEVVAENLSADCLVTCLPAVYGKQTTDSPMALIRQDGEAYTFGSMAVGLNVSLKFEGTFNLTSLILSFNVHGAM